MSKKEVKLMECFNSLQGEGPHSGIGMIILRCLTCNKQCLWCDTAIKMRISMEASYKISDLQKRINKSRMGILVTGGECTVPRHFNDTLMMLNDLSYPIADVETNGFRLKELIQAVDSNKPVYYMYSPKFFSEKDLQAEIKNTEKLVEEERVFIKVVYEDSEYIKNYLEFLNERIRGIPNEYRKVWLMVEGTNRSDLIRNSGPVFDACEKYNFNFSSRDHIMFGFV